ncbi:MAG: LacI family DNA-binding transcriptional regulator [Anaerolineales bacterium]|nr:LacI family DNA-binding transcriptional regulator [Anaerolineales bacterium]
MPTIRDVAKLANVGIATVSRVLNNNPSVSDETRKAVLAAIEALDYTPNPIARQLSTGRTLTVGVILPYLTMPSYVERLRGVQHALAETEYNMILFSVGSPSERDSYFKDLPRNNLVDGILIISLPPNDNQAERFARAEIPTVLIDAYHSQLCCILTDDVKGGKLATQHLISLGHRKISFLSDFLETPFRPSARYRYQGYRKALEENGIPFNPAYHISGERGRENAKKMANHLLNLDDPPSAIFAGNDIQAIGVLDAARESGVKVPDDLSVVGFDGIRDAEYTNLTTIDQHLYQSGVDGVNILIDALDIRPETPLEKRLSLNLIARGTTQTFSQKT